MAKVRIPAKRQDNNNIKLRPSGNTQLGDLRREQERHQKVRRGNLAVLVACFAGPLSVFIDDVRRARTVFGNAGRPFDADA